MPRSLPDTLAPYRFHGLDIQFEDGIREVVTDCPFCGREGKFSIAVEDGQWRCFVCHSGSEKGGGNVYTFLRMLWEESDKATDGASNELAEDRGYLYPETINQWGICKSIISGDWLVPGHGLDGKLNQLYKWLQMPDRKLLMPTPKGLGMHPFGIPMFNERKQIVYLMESLWDALALWEVMRFARAEGEKLTLTGNESISLLSQSNIVAISGCGAVGEPLTKWAPILADKRVVLCFHSDYPKEIQGKLRTPAGFANARKATEILAAGDNPPKEIHYLNWGKLGYDPDLKSGYDVRDALTEAGQMPARITALEGLLKKVTPIPADWIGGRGRAGVARGSTEIEPLACDKWEELVGYWGKTMIWPKPGEKLDKALAAILACIISTRSVGDPVWVKMLGPASCGKSTLCEAVAVSKKHVRMLSTITGFYSGFKEKGGDDASLIAELYNKCLVWKDGDTLLRAPNREQILAEGRDIYDGCSSSFFKNRTGREYKGIKMTVVLSGTNALKQIDESELGERFVDVVVMEEIDDDEEDLVNMMVGRRAFQNIGIIADGDIKTHYDAARFEAMQRTGGYVNYLSANATRLLSEVAMSDERIAQCAKLGKFVSYMRARPAKKHDENKEREFSSRLVSQHVRLACCLAAVLNKREVDEQVMDRVRQISLDTARGKGYNVAKILHREGRVGVETPLIALEINEKDEDTKRLLKFMKHIQAVESFLPVRIARDGKKTQGRIRWRLTDRIYNLFSLVVLNWNRKANDKETVDAADSETKARPSPKKKTRKSRPKPSKTRAHKR